MSVPHFRDDQWQRVYAFLKSLDRVYVKQELATRLFFEAVLWIARSGSPWRMMPEAVGNWNSVYQRFARWQKKGIWQALMDHFASDADLEWALIDATVVRAHACAAGAKKTRVLKPLDDPKEATPPKFMGSPTALATQCSSS